MNKQNELKKLNLFLFRQYVLHYNHVNLRALEYNNLNLNFLLFRYMKLKILYFI